MDRHKHTASIDVYNEVAKRFVNVSRQEVKLHTMTLLYGVGAKHGPNQQVQALTDYMQALGFKKVVK